MIDRYEVLKQLGRGRFGTTWLVRDTQDGVERVLKRISTRRAAFARHEELDVLSGHEGKKILELFEREAAVLRQLDHPGIPNYVDFFTHETEDGDVELCLVQEKIEGQTLRQRLDSGTRFTEAEVLDIGRQAASILAYLHDLAPPVIHRDLKPSNIMLTDDGHVALIDFGAAMDALEPDGSSTIIGTFGYMPFEQYEGRATPASDVYSLGVTLVELLTRRAPKDLERLNMSLDYHDYVNIEPWLRDLLDRMIAPNRADRPHDGNALLEALEQRSAEPPKPAVKREAIPAIALIASVALFAVAGLLVVVGVPLWFSGAVVALALGMTLIAATTREQRLRKAAKTKQTLESGTTVEQETVAPASGIGEADEQHEPVDANEIVELDSAADELKKAERKKTPQ